MAFRNSLKQNIFLQMLEEGYHRSFSEIFTLLITDEERRAATEPGSALSLQAPLEGQRDKLETMTLYLNQAEQAERTDSWSVVCEQRLFLGHYFSAPEDLWLSLHFYHSCAHRESRGCSRPATEARAELAEIYLQRGELEQARQQAELCFKQAVDNDWQDSAGQSLRLRAGRALWAANSRLAAARSGAADYRETLTLLHRGYSVASKCEDKRIEGTAAYRLGLTYQKTGDHDTAKQFFSTCMQIWDTLQDTDGLGKTYLGMAKSLESEGNTHEAVQFLEKVVDISRGDEMRHNLAGAYLCLGIIYHRKSQYEKAFEFLLLSYDVASYLSDVDLLEQTQVFVASARAQCLIRKYGADVASGSSSALRRLVAWKESGGGQGLSTDSTDNLAWCSN
ncbi:tetratricopeptide repeat protein 29 [Pempheris klunzingeri]|uniref:tetratricopeptide repeat protein 29 n=1 Tax=Pempheris klunzingeri TaxID=3127111 RepID=UPI0039817909